MALNQCVGIIMVSFNLECDDMLPIDSSDIYFIQDGLKCLKTFKFQYTFESEF